MQSKILLLEEIENKYDVKSIKCNNVCIWPILHYFFTLDEKEKLTFLEIQDQYSHPIYSRKKYLFYKLKILCLKLFKYRSVDALYIGRKDEKKGFKEGKRIHQFKKGWVDLMDELGTYHFLDTSIQSDDIFSVIKNDYPFTQKSLRFDGLLEFLEYLKFDYPDLKLNLEKLARFLNNVFIKKEIYQHYFSCVRPKEIYYTVFFYRDAFALSLVSSKLKLKSVEIQHGQQGIENIHYQFLRRNIGKYEFLPKYTWVWGKTSYNRFRQDRKSHVIIAGHPCYIEKPNTHKKGIKDVLVALQPTDNPIPPFLEKAMLNKTDIKWFIRLHPRMLAELAFYKEKYQEYKHILFDEANNCPLPKLLSKVAYIITQWSTVIYEGVLFNCMGILISQKGKDLMQEDISEGVLKTALDTEQLLKILETDFEVSLGNNFFLQDRDKILENLKKFRQYE